MPATRLVQNLLAEWDSRGTDSSIPPYEAIASSVDLCIYRNPDSSVSQSVRISTQVKGARATAIAFRLRLLQHS